MVAWVSHHVTQRGNRRADVFWTDEDRRRYLVLLQEYAAKPIDGKDIWPLMSGQPGAKSPHAAFLYYNAWQLEAVRSGKWKLVLPHQYYAVAEPGKDGMPGKHVWAGMTLALYDLENDIGEQADVSGDHPDVVDRLLARVAEAREDLGDGVMQVNPEEKDFFRSRRLYRIPGKNTRPPGRA